MHMHIYATLHMGCIRTCALCYFTHALCTKGNEEGRAGSGEASSSSASSSAQQYACSSSSNPTGTSTTTDSETRIIHRNARIIGVN